MMNRDAIRAQVVEFVNAETGQNLTGLADDTSLRDGLGLDSLDLTGVLLRLEDHYQIELSRLEVKEVQTVGQLLALLETKLGQPQRTAA